ncbi:hypothetical protein TorRG33x02_070880 [Trema orientale]|uniref:Uncharacterized protein n=1 Tax=Trema orientale TaxID=63057 RepID=A0A2P5FGY2_TREOI|nr:hypothetical protein TorRG33x02_070880 [Trema orientale]
MPSRTTGVRPNQPPLPLDVAPSNARCNTPALFLPQIRAAPPSPERKPPLHLYITGRAPNRACDHDRQLLLAPATAQSLPIDTLRQPFASTPAPAF